MGITMTTARTHRRWLYEETETNGLLDLIRMLAWLSLSHRRSLRPLSSMAAPN